jgi:hypothetical protein
MESTFWPAISPAGDRVVLATNGLLLVREAPGGRVRGSGFPGGPTSVHPGGHTILTLLEGRACVWEILPDAEPVAARSGPGEAAWKAGAASSRQTREKGLFWAGLRSDGRLAMSLASGPGGREVIRLADPATGRPIGRPAWHSPGWVVRAAVLGPDGRSFATGSNPPAPGLAAEVRLWDTITGRSLLPPMLHTN